MRFLVRYRRTWEPSALEILRVCAAGVVVDCAGTRMFLVEASIGAINALEKSNPSWRVSPEVEYTLASAKPEHTALAEETSETAAFVAKVALSVTPDEQTTLEADLISWEDRYGLTSDELLSAVLDGRVPITPDIEQWLALIRQRRLIRAVGGMKGMTET